MKGGPKELIVNGRTGLVVKANSSQALIDAMTFFLNDRTSISRMGMEARYFTEDREFMPTTHTLQYSGVIL